MWGWKSPKDLFCFDGYVSMLRNPHIIVVFRNILDVLTSTAMHEEVDFVSSAVDVADVYKELCQFITFTCLPVALVNFERMRAAPSEMVSSIDKWLDANASVETLSAAANFTQVGRGEYKEISQSGAAVLSFDDRELAMDRADAKFVIYNRRITEFTKRYSELFNDLKKAMDIKRNLETELHNRECSINPGPLTAEECPPPQSTILPGSSDVALSGYLRDLRLDDLIHRARLAEADYYAAKARHAAVLAARMATQKELDNLVRQM